MHGDGPAGEARAAAPGDDGETHFVGQAHHGLDLFRGLGEEHELGQLQAQVRGVRGAFHQGVRCGADAFGGQQGLEPLVQGLLEGRVGVELFPEMAHGDVQDGRVLAGEGRSGDVQAALDALAHHIGVHERVVAHQEEFGGKTGGQVAHVGGPLGVSFQIDKAEDAAYELFVGNGNMGS